MRPRLGGEQAWIWLTGCATDDEATARAARITRTLAPLAKVGRASEAKAFAAAMGRAAAEDELSRIQEDAARVLEDAAKGVTVRSFAERWLSGELARLDPDHVRAIDQTDNRERCEAYVFPVIGDRSMAGFSREDADLVMAKLPAHLARGSRRHVAQILHRLGVLAVEPGKLLRASPIPKGWLPRVPKPKGTPFLYPEEDARLLACAAIPLEHRFAYGLLAREGMRTSELVGLAATKDRPASPPLPWTAFDLTSGTVTLDHTKTGDVRTWKLGEGTRRALARWRELHPDAVTVLPHLKDLARMLRRHLHVAGVDRAELRTRSTTRTWLKAHHLRATFVTLSLASGKTEQWVMDRTGHTTSAMVQRYRRAARNAAELELGALRPLDEAIPELRSEP
ncbi:MAG TPA: tyrosine-type recombinase/integrase [Polyangiaceae bacterium]|jgi:hypothetical protein